MFLLLALVTNAMSAESVYDIARKGAKCERDQRTKLLDCEYRIGKDLLISIAGVGLPMAGISFLKSDAKGDFYGAFAMWSGCVNVMQGERSGIGMVGSAFISPMNGKVYLSWVDCKDAE